MEILIYVIVVAFVIYAGYRKNRQWDLQRRPMGRGTTVNRSAAGNMAQARNTWAGGQAAPVRNATAARNATTPRNTTTTRNTASTRNTSTTARHVCADHPDPAEQLRKQEELKRRLLEKQASKQAASKPAAVKQAPTEQKACRTAGVGWEGAAATEEFDAADAMAEVYDILACGYWPQVSKQRDFVAEGLEMLQNIG